MATDRSKKTPTQETIHQDTQETAKIISGKHVIKLNLKMRVPIDSVFPNDFNPNELDETLYKSLVDNLSKKGQQYPIIINPNGMIIDGENRWKAMKQLGFKEIDVEIRDLDRIQSMILNYRLNRERGHLNPFKEAKMFKELVDSGLSYSQIANYLGIDKDQVYSRLTLLKVDETSTRVDGVTKLSPSHWELVATLKPQTQIKFVREIVDKDLSVRESEKIVKFYRTLDSIPTEYRNLLQEVRKIRRGTTPHKPDLWNIPEDFTFFFFSEYLNMTEGHWDLFPVRNFILSAYHYLHKGTLRFTFAKGDLLSVVSSREEIENLILDSGMIGALRRKDLNYLHRSMDIITLAEIIRADVVVHLDVNMEPVFLRENNLTPKEAMKHTINNAEILLNENFSGKKCFVVQGWTLEQYDECIKQFNDMGIFDEEHWIGIGTTCMRRPPTLYRVYDFCVKRIHEINPRIHVHAFGIAKPEWIVNLYRMGVKSSDSATPDLACAFNQLIIGEDKKIRGFKQRTRKMYASQVIYNYWVYYILLNDEFKKKGGT